jgi:hypothetical protein
MLGTRPETPDNQSTRPSREINERCLAPEPMDKGMPDSSSPRVFQQAALNVGMKVLDLTKVQVVER